MEKKGREQQREETRERVYQAALRVFERDGFAECRIDDIAKEANVVRGTFYFHFPTKEDVLQVVIERSSVVVAEAIQALPKDLPLPSVLSALCVALSEAWVATPKLFPEVALVALRLAAKGPSEISGQLRATLAERFERAAANEFLKPQIPAALLADFFLVNIFAAMLAWSNIPALPLEGVLQQVAQLFLDGAAKR
jgi:AcrR family transcriptional regulator